jgi:NAD(P)-dependent dehydrogenase (short-subunit alcohol dehydrogenase family)
MAAKVWFITGASSGFGEAFARYALSRGDSVVATARDTARLASLVKLAPDRVLAQRLDVARSGEAHVAVKAGVERFGRLDIVVNNAGYGVVGAVEETGDGELRALMDTNFFGAAEVIRAALPTLRAQRGGAIVNISSMGGQMSFAGFGAYSASKFALEGLSEALAAEVAPFGIKVMIIEPGQFRTNLAGSGMRHMPELDAYADTVGLTRGFAHGMHQTQEGDPLKAAAAIAKALESHATPLRLALGKDSVDAIRTHAEGLLSDLATWEAVSVDTRID